MDHILLALDQLLLLLFVLMYQEYHRHLLQLPPLQPLVEKQRLAVVVQRQRVLPPPLQVLVVVEPPLQPLVELDIVAVVVEEELSVLVDFETYRVVVAQVVVQVVVAVWPSYCCFGNNFVVVVVDRMGQNYRRAAVAVVVDNNNCYMDLQ
ncbi:hypothetical protein BDA99DRAFT_508048 [Phascolomyces articulosus]|uniref:Secreted protein n=1 Tax=Phascolomyces articulosus TaxID=60185 RepID=A0AAD5PEZ5_9FUNG|nr:hypothetical protein BDA99DRAFT_508048 [Phascolomyces articulosus]